MLQAFQPQLQVKHGLVLLNYILEVGEMIWCTQPNLNPIFIENKFWLPPFNLQILLGTGKSSVIQVVSMHAERILRKAGDKPNHPRVLLLAHTGKAASIIGKLM